MHEANIHFTRNSHILCQPIKGMLSSYCQNAGQAQDCSIYPCSASQEQAACSLPLHFLDRGQAQSTVSPYLKKQKSSPTRSPTEAFCWAQNEKQALPTLLLVSQHSGNWNSFWGFHGDFQFHNLVYFITGHLALPSKSLPLLFLLYTNFNIINKSSAKPNSQKDTYLAKSHGKGLIFNPSEADLETSSHMGVAYLEGDSRKQ